MSTIACVDYRRTDLRTNVLENPYWITSGLVVGTANEDKGALVFSFPTAGKNTLVLGVAFEVVAAVTGTTPLIHVGYGTIATDAAVTGDNITYDADDTYMLHEDITLTAGAISYPTTGNTSTWLTAIAAWQFTAGSSLIVGAASTTPCVWIHCTDSGTILTGTYRLHMLICNVPGK